MILIADHLKIIRVNVINNDDAYTIFEILNARGINLSPVDLIKNKVLQEWNGTYPIDFAKRKWNEIVSLLSSRDTSVGLEEYSIHHWTTKFAYTSKRNLYKAFKKQWANNSFTAESYLNELHSDCSIYIKIISPQITDWSQADQRPIYNSLLALKTFNVSIMRSFLLSLFKAKKNNIITQKTVIVTLQKIENFHFMFNSICSLRPSGIEGLYAKCARNLSSATNRTDARRVINELTGTLSQKKPSKDNFVDKYKKLQFSNKNTTNKKLIQYIFIKYERHLRQTNEFEPSDFSLEHIMPQSDATIADEIKSCIGNLLPLGQSLNGQANILTFDEKKEVYRQSDYRVVDKFLERTPQNIWTAQDIDNRTTELAELSYDDIWL
ncbi:HNH endonuclease family protein [Buttiauxella agrestis]